jgi:hypothetical protein
MRTLAQGRKAINNNRQGYENVTVITTGIGWKLKDIFS